MENGAERILKSFEEQAVHRREIEREKARAQEIQDGRSHEDKKRGQLLAFILCAISICGATWCGIVGSQIAASVLGGSTLIGLAAVFIGGRIPKGPAD